MEVWVLIILLLVSNGFWAYNCHKLFNKLMSKNYYEYQQTEQAFKKKPNPPPKKVQEKDDAEVQAEVLNGLMGIPS